MESALDAAGAMAADEATCDPPLSSGAPSPPPPADPPPPPAASSKRRWSPCTWRYAIEDAQAELPSRPPRATAPFGSTALPPHSSRTPHSSSSQQQSIKLAKPSCYNPLYGKAGEDPPRISSYPPSRLHVVVEPPPARSSAPQPPPHFKSRTREIYRRSHNHQQSRSKARPCEEDEEEEGGDAEEDAHEYDDHDHEVAVYDEEYFKIRRREMSPSELYFCAMCSTKAAETKGTTEPCAYDSS